MATPTNESTIELHGTIQSSVAARALGTNLEPQIVDGRTAVAVIANYARGVKPRGSRSPVADFAEIIWCVSVNWKNDLAWYVYALDIERSYVKEHGISILSPLRLAKIGYTEKSNTVTVDVSNDANQRSALRIDTLHTPSKPFPLRPFVVSIGGGMRLVTPNITSELGTHRKGKWTFSTSSLVVHTLGELPMWEEDAIQTLGNHPYMHLARQIGFSKD